MHQPHGWHSHHPDRTWEYAQQDPSEQAVQETHHRLGTILHPANNSITVSVQDITQRKREEELFILAAIVESSDDAIFSTTLEGRVLSWNKSAEHLYGYSAQEMLGKPVHTIVPADRRQELEDILRQLREGHRLDHFETVRRRKDGSSIDVSLTISRVRDATGKIIGASTIARDITERKQLEEKLRESERRFRALIEKSSDAIVLIGMEPSVLYASSSTTHLLGYAPEELLNRNAFELIHPADLETMLYALGCIVQEPEANVIVECRVRYKHGTFRWMEASVTNYLDEPGVHAIVCNYRDITERKLLEERIWQSEQQLHEIVDSSPAIISLKDIHGHYILINEQGERFFHLTKQNILGKTDDDLFPQEIAATLRANDQAVLQTGKTYKWEEVVPQDDGLHTYLAVKFPLFDPTGAPYAVCGISTDITERKLREQRKDDFIHQSS